MIAQILTIVTIIVGDLAAALLVLILWSRQQQAAYERNYAGRREMLVQKFIRYIAGDFELAELKAAAANSPRVAQDIMLTFLRELQGEGRHRLILASVELGLLGTLLRDLHSWNWVKRDLAAMRLGVYSLPETVPDLAALLRDPRIEVRYTAARSLGLIGSPEAVEALKGILGYPDIVDTPRILEIVQIMGGEATEPLRQMLASSTNGHVTEMELLAIDLVGDLHDVSMIGSLHRMLRSTETEKVLRALKAIGRIGATQQIEDFLLLARDRSWEVRAQVARTIGLLKIEEAIPLLETGLSDQSFWVRRNCAEALANFGARGEESLVQALRSSDLFARDVANYFIESRFEEPAAGELAAGFMSSATRSQRSKVEAVTS